MPNYEYECLKCHRVVELSQKLSERIAPMCCNDNCNIETVQKISKTNFSLKGSGWASDGYASKRKQ